jgi:antitoxin component YwqK of YwqJK toxin-antitoxin module
MTMLRSAAPAILRLAIGMTATLGAVPAPAQENFGYSSPAFEAGQLPPDEAEPALLDRSVPQGQTEVIHERYPNGAVKIERHVAQDAEGNYFNHGPWTYWDQQGRLIAAGEFRQGKRHGRWVREFKANEGELFQLPLFKQFTAPFASEATFVNGQLHGSWEIYDFNRRHVSSWEFKNGKRHGQSVWFHPTGKPMRQAEFNEDAPVGVLREWDANGKLTADQRYINGYRLAVQTEWFAPQQKKTEGSYLFARDITRATFDWWRGIARVATTGKDGQDERHGSWAAWDRNGQKLLEGTYEHDAPVGTFTWWHPNGQKSIQGAYREGRPDGKWTWWHANGQKQIEGEYVLGEQTDQWIWWNQDGQVAEAAVYSGGRAENIAKNTPDSQAGKAQAKRPSTTRR